TEDVDLRDPRAVSYREVGATAPDRQRGVGDRLHVDGRSAAAARPQPRYGPVANRYGLHRAFRRETSELAQDDRDPECAHSPFALSGSLSAGIESVPLSKRAFIRKNGSSKRL